MAKQMVFFVSGAARSVGLETAKLALKRGHKVIAADMDLQGAERLAAAAPLQAFPVALDVRDPHSWEAAIDAGWAHMGGIDCFINNADVIYGGDALSQSELEMRHMIDVNLFGVVNGIRAFLPRFLEQGAGQIVSVAGLASFVPVKGQAFYSATKHAIRAYHYGVAMEHEEGPVGFSFIAPGGLDGDMLDNVLGRAHAETAFANPLLKPEAVAQSILSAAIARTPELVIPSGQGPTMLKLTGVFPGWLKGWTQRADRRGRTRLAKFTKKTGRSR